MRIVKLNDVVIDIDEKTAIGVDFQTYDIENPGQKKIKISNKFTIPATSHNLKQIGYAGTPGFTSTLIYDALICDYWLDNEHIIKGAKARIDQVTDRISIFAYEKPNFWDEIKLLLWEDFTSEFLEFLQDQKSYPSVSNPFLGNIGEFLLPYINSTEGLILPFYFGNLYKYEPVEDSGIFLENTDTIWLKYYPDTADEPLNGGHFCAYAKTIFEFIEWKYDVDFLTAGGQAIGNLWDDQFATKMYIPLRNIDVRYNYDGLGVNNGFYFDVIGSGKFSPNDDAEDKADKSLYDFVNGFFQVFNVVKDEIIVEGSEVIRLARFDDIENLAEVKDWSGNISTKKPIKFSPLIKGFGQSNVIKYSSIYEDGDSLIGARFLTSLNKNTDATKTLFEIDGHIPAFTPITGGVIPDLSTSESFSTFEFLISDGVSSDIINIKISEDTPGELTATFNLQKASVYSLSGEYLLFDEMIKYPKVYEVEKWLTLNDVRNLEFFKLYYIMELNGSFFLNKIKGFNPDKSNSATKLELIRISDRTPIQDYVLEYYTDGVNDPFVDSNGDYFI